MKLKKNSTLIVGILLVALFIGCDKTTESETDWGDADFTSFVSIGNSLTAGVSDGALFKDAQKNSFPNLIAKMADIDNDFEQPIMGGDGFSFDESEGRISLNIFSAVPSIDFLPAGTEQNRNLNRPYNNLGIPLIRAEQLYTVTTSIEADSNHFVDKILRGSGRTVIQEALTLDPTLLTLWVGNNDVLESAALGLADPELAYTKVNDFSTHFNTVINELTSGTDAPIFVANIFDITDLPYFTSLPPYITSGGNKTYIFGDCENGVRQLTDDDLILFWALPDYFTMLQNRNISEITALNDTLILDVEEKIEIRAVINQFNDIIKTAVDANNQLYLVDMYSIFKTIATNGYTLGGINYTADLIYFDDEGLLNLNLLNTLFSYDALHPNEFGYASFANSFITVINSSLNADLPLVEATDL